MTTNLSKQDRPSQIRVFVAVELPEALREFLGRLQLSAGPAADVAKWVAPDLLHITLRFLGEIPEERIGALESGIRDAARAVEPFALQLATTGAFPHPRNPRVLWVGLQRDEGVASLQRLQSSVEYSLEQYDFGRDAKPFSPHITVARLRDRASQEQRRTLGAAWLDLSTTLDASPRSFPVDTVTIMRSDLRSEGPRYTALARIPLKQPQTA